MERLLSDLESALINVVEKTSSTTYQIVLSRLYSLRFNTTVLLNVKQVRYCLVDFFSALQSLGIFPINDPNSPKVTWNCDSEVYHTVMCCLDSKTYQYPISRLYHIYVKNQEEFDEQYLQKVLDDFFSSLKAQKFEPIDEKRFKNEFSEEYTHVFSRFNWRELIMARVGWSYDGELISNPRFYSKR